jgi:hypothetical protein
VEVESAVKAEEKSFFFLDFGGAATKVANPRRALTAGNGARKTARDVLSVSES